MTLSQPPAIDGASVSAYEVPTETPESDGTLQWESTTLVLVELSAGSTHGLGYSYADTATARLIQDKLLPLVKGSDPTAIPQTWTTMLSALRNLGKTGVSAMAVSAVDNALWDLKAKLLNLSVAGLLGEARRAIPAYGSGGFTSYSLAQLQQQIERWNDDGFRFVKIKVGRQPGKDIRRVQLTREKLTDRVELFVDANGAYSLKQALFYAEGFAKHGVTWFEEPVASTNLEGLNLMRGRAPAGMHISAGEYGYDLVYFTRMLLAGAVDVLQADATRCAGITGFMGAAALCEGFNVPLSSHCAPALHVHTCCAARAACHLEYFHDHARIEKLLFDGAPAVVEGMLSPSWDRPGLGLEFKHEDARAYAI